MRATLPLLSKSDYLAGLHCPKRLYLNKYHRELSAPFSESDAARMKDGQEVGLLARACYPDGVLISSTGDEAFRDTANHLRSAFAIFEAQVQAGQCVARFDILKRSPQFRWGIAEVKSSTKCKDDHLQDVAFQLEVGRNAGLRIESAELMLVNNGYVADGPLTDLSRYFTRQDVTKEVEDLLPEVRARIASMQEVIESGEPPKIETNTYCKGCAYHDHCHVDQPKHDVVHLYRITDRQVSKIRSDGFSTIDAIPDGYKLTDSQKRMRDVIVAGAPYVGSPLAEGLKSWKYPLYFIDFEAAGWAIPHLSGIKPYEQLPFQWSCHILRSARASLEHRYFLHDEDSDPRKAFCESLLEHVRSAGSVVVYSKYEWTMLKRMKDALIPFAEALCALFEEKSIDLLKIVQEHVYLEEFNGSYSIKSVLPAIVPELSYKDLAIQDGNTAAVQYKRRFALGTSAEDQKLIEKALLDYCERDTLAMVELYRAMKKLCGIVDPVPPPPSNLEIGDQLALNI